TFPEQQKVRRAEAIILKTAQGGIAVNVRSAKRGLKIKRHRAPCIGNRFRNQQTQSHSSRPIARDRRTRGGSNGRGALIRAVAVFGLIGNGVLIQGKVVAQVNSPAAKRKRGVRRRKELLEVHEIIQLQMIVE